MVIKQYSNLYNDSIPYISFNTDDYILDLDILIIDLSHIVRSFEDKFSFHSILNKYCLPEEINKKFKHDFLERKTQIDRFLKNGGSIFIFGAQKSNLTYTSIKETTEGDVEISNRINLLDFLSLDSKSFEFELRKGSNFIFKEKGEVFNFSEINYEFILSKYSGTPLFEVKNTKEPIGVKIIKNSGNIFLMPIINFPINYHEHGEYFKYFHKEFQEIKSEVPISKLPEWCNEYILENEAKDRNKLESLSNELNRLETCISEQQLIIGKHDELKRILISTGDELEILVSKLFSELGYEIIEVQLNRDDIIIKKDNSIGVIEIKGVKGSSAEKHAAQLMKWVSTYHSENDIQPKGILIVNGFKDTPLLERTEKVFTDQMLPYCKRMELCLLTTKQLVNIIVNFRNNKITFEDIHNLLFNTIGEIEA